jgi:hypothetical protein
LEFNHLKHKTFDTEWLVLPTLRYGEQANEQRTVFDQLAVNVAQLFPKDAKSTPDWKLLRTKLISDDVKQAVKNFYRDLAGPHPCQELLECDGPRRRQSSDLRFPRQRSGIDEGGCDDLFLRQ